MLQMLIELVAHLIQRTPKNRKHLIQLPTHTHTLRTLTSKQKRQSTNTTHRNSTLNHIKRRLTPRKQRKTTQQHLPINTQHHRTMLKHRTTNQRKPNIQQLQPHHAINKLQQTPRLLTQRRLAPTREHTRNHTSTIPTNNAARSLNPQDRLEHRCIFKNHMSVSAADPERGHSCAAGLAIAFPRSLLCQEGDTAR